LRLFFVRPAELRNAEWEMDWQEYHPFNKNNICRMALIMVLFAKLFSGADMPRKAKTATSSDLPSWVDSRQEKGLYSLPVSKLSQSFNSLRKLSRRLLQAWQRKTESCASAAVF
jgi:hypothetical protein